MKSNPRALGVHKKTMDSSRTPTDSPRTLVWYLLTYWHEDDTYHQPRGDDVPWIEEGLPRPDPLLSERRVGGHATGDDGGGGTRGAAAGGGRGGGGAGGGCGGYGGGRRLNAWDCGGRDHGAVGWWSGGEGREGRRRESNTSLLGKTFTLEYPHMDPPTF